MDLSTGSTCILPPRRVEVHPPARQEAEVRSPWRPLGSVVSAAEETTAGPPGEPCMLQVESPVPTAVAVAEEAALRLTQDPPPEVKGEAFRLTPKPRLESYPTFRMPQEEFPLAIRFSQG